MSSILDSSGSEAPACCSATARVRSCFEPGLGEEGLIGFHHEGRRLRASALLHLCRQAGARAPRPSPPARSMPGSTTIHQDGRRVFKFAPCTSSPRRARGAAGARGLLRGGRRPLRPAPGQRAHHRCGPGAGWACRRAGRSRTSTATATRRARRIPLCLHEASESGRLKKGDTLLMAGFGAGLAWLGLVSHQVGAGSPARGRRPSVWAATSSSPTARCARRTPRPPGCSATTSSISAPKGPWTSSRAPTSRSRPSWWRRSGFSACCALRGCASTSPSGTAWASSRRWSRRAPSASSTHCASCGGGAKRCSVPPTRIRAACRRSSGWTTPRSRRFARRRARTAWSWRPISTAPARSFISGGRPRSGGAGGRAGQGGHGAKRVIPLAVSGAFHSPLVRSALGPLREEFERTEWSTPYPAFFSACSVGFETGGFSELLQRQLISPVRFTQSVSTLFAAGYDAFLEVGPRAPRPPPGSSASRP